MRLQTVLKADSKICDVGELYFHKNGEYLLADGFFNLFYIEKHKKYTDINRLELCLKLKGWERITLMHDMDEIYSEELQSGEAREYSFALPYTEVQDGVFWFKLKDDGKIGNKITEGYYDGSAGTSPRDVEIAVDICSYKHEERVIRNMCSINDAIFRDAGKEVRDHLSIMIIDNGQTLAENRYFCGIINAEDRIRLYPNKNTGSAGGFTRGMIEAISHNESIKEEPAGNEKSAGKGEPIGKEEPAGNEKSAGKGEPTDKEEPAGKGKPTAKDKAFTHILLMEDDAVFEPDIFVRLYGFLSFLKEEYKAITVGGALMSEDIPYLQYASGEQYKEHKTYNPYMMKDMRIYENCVSEYMCSAETAVNTYSVWQCCCYSMETVDRENLPLPMFKHCDDIEYGLRNRDKGIVFINGVCVWHKGSEYAFPGADRYYDIRNRLITEAMNTSENSWMQALKITLGAMTETLLSYRYNETELAYYGLFDFCRGPKWLYSQDTEEINRTVSKYEVYETYPRLHAYFTDEDWNPVNERLEQGSEEAVIKSGLMEIYSGSRQCDGSHDREQRLSLNGWLRRAKDRPMSEIKLVSAIDPVSLIYREPYVILYEPSERKAHYAVKDYGRFAKLIWMILKACWIAFFRYDLSAKEYRRNYKSISSYESWKKYIEC